MFSPRIKPLVVSIWWSRFTSPPPPKEETRFEDGNVHKKKKKKIDEMKDGLREGLRKLEQPSLKRNLRQHLTSAITMQYLN